MNERAKLRLPNTKNARVIEKLRDENHNEYDQEQRNQAESYSLGSLLHILHNVISEGIQLQIGNTLVTINARV